MSLEACARLCVRVRSLTRCRRDLFAAYACACWSAIAQPNQQRAGDTLLKAKIRDLSDQRGSHLQRDLSTGWKQAGGDARVALTWDGNYANQWDGVCVQFSVPFPVSLLLRHGARGVFALWLTTLRQ